VVDCDDPVLHAVEGSTTGEQADREVKQRSCRGQAKTGYATQPQRRWLLAEQAFECGAAEWGQIDRGIRWLLRSRDACGFISNNFPITTSTSQLTFRWFAPRDRFSVRWSAYEKQQGTLYG
jgi:hypothetical protein